MDFQLRAASRNLIPEYDIIDRYVHCHKVFG